MSRLESARFISFEGVEGCGKSTQINRLQSHFESQGQNVVSTLEPGGTDVGQVCRSLILGSDYDFQHPLSELLMFTVDRLEHINQVLQPALDEGKRVLCDRYIDSTYAYQHSGKQIDYELVAHTLSYCTLMPDLTILLDLDPEEGLRRASERADLDRFEKEDIAFHHRVRSGYLSRAELAPERFLCIDVNGLDEDAVFDAIMKEGV